MKPLDLILREKLNIDGKTDKNITAETNPLYVSLGEVINLLKNTSDEDTKEMAEDLPGLENLVKLFNLDETEKKALLILLAPEIDPKYERIYAYIQDDLNRKYATIRLMSFLLSGNGNAKNKILAHFLPNFPLQKFSLVKICDGPDEVPYIHRPLRIEESVKNYIIQLYRLDERIKSFCRLTPPLNNGENLSKSKDLLVGIKEGIQRKKRFLVHLYGPSDSEKRNTALVIASQLGYGLLTVNTPIARQNFQSFEELFRILFRESMLSGSLIYFDNFDSVFEDEKYLLHESMLFDVLDELSWLTFFSSRKQWKPKHLPREILFAEHPFPHPAYDESIRLWKENLEEVDGALAREVGSGPAQLFKFTEGEIEEVVRIVKAFKYTGQKIDKKLVYDVCRERVSAELNNLAQNLRLPYRLGDIVLLDEQKKQLENIISSYRNQYKVFEDWGFKRLFLSSGISALFTGPPGTGKTMAAAIMANEMGLDLYRIDLSRIVSKYIGETEKNLAKIFDAADGSGVILFFDEADALFGKRTAVRDAHDRYANIEVSYLLQRIEEYNGPVILASNFRRNIDEAFVRRIHFVLEFPFPDERMRESIWAKVFPPQAPMDNNIDFKFLAKRFKVSGGNIRNIALSSAFFAAEDGCTINMKHVVHGVKSELQKVGKTFEPSDFGSYWV